MSVSKNYLRIHMFLGLIIVTASLWMTYIFLSSLIKADPNVQASVITFIGAVIGVLYTQVHTQKREIKSRHFVEKKTAYLRLINFTFDFLENNRKGIENTDEKFLPQFMEFKKDLLVWGDQEVITSYYNFEDFSNKNPDAAREDLLLLVDDLYRAMRKDLGHNDNKLPRGNLVSINIIAEDRQKLIDLVCKQYP